MKMKFTDVLFWYNRHELEITEDEVLHELSFDKKTGKEKTPPNAYIIREIALHRIKKQKEKYKFLRDNYEMLQDEINKRIEALEAEG